MKRFDFLTETFGVILTIIQSNELFQLISLILTCLATVISIAYTFYIWYKKAKEDGKITKEEIEEIKEKIKRKGNNLWK